MSIYFVAKKMFDTCQNLVIHWEIDGYGGSSVVTSKSFDKELDGLVRAGYIITSIERHI
jgi:hypothetical protein